MSAGYQSPHGRPRGLARRLADLAGRLQTAGGGVPGIGDAAAGAFWGGLIEDLRMATRILNKREWLEAMRLSPDPEAQRFADELLADDETLDASWQAAETAQRNGTLGVDADTTDPVECIEHLDRRVAEQHAAYLSIRRVLEQAGVADAATPDEELPALIGVLLS